MKKYLFLAAAIIVSGCGVKTEEHNRVVAQRDSLELIVSQLKSQIDELENGEQRLVGQIESKLSDQNYIEVVKLIDALKTRHPESSSLSSYSANLSKFQQMADEQQAAIDKHVRDSVRMANIGNLGIWTIKYFVDEFDEPTDDGYITTSSPIHGTFSNTATQNSPLRVHFIISEDNIAFKLFEYDGDNPVKGYKDNYDVLVQDKSGKRYHLHASNYDSDRLTITSYSKIDGLTHTQILNKILMDGGNIKFRVIDSDRSSTQYNFDIENADWYENAYYKLTGVLPE